MEKKKEEIIIYSLVDEKIISKEELAQYNQGLLDVSIVSIPIEKCINISKLRYNLAIERKNKIAKPYHKLIKTLSNIETKNNNVYIVSFAIHGISKILYINNELTKILHVFIPPSE